MRTYRFLDTVRSCSARDRFAWLASPLLLGTLASSAQASSGGSPSITIEVPEAEPTVELKASEFPSDGVITGRVLGCDACDIGELTVTDSHGGVIEGTITDLTNERGDGEWLFQPDEDLAIGMFLVDYPDALGSTFDVMGQAVGVPEISAAVGLTETNQVYLTCTHAAGDSSVQFQLEQDVKGEFHLHLTGVSASQYRYVYEFDGQRLETFEPDFVQPVEEAASELCYSISATQLPAGDEFTLVEDCLRSPTVDDLGYLRTPSSEIERFLLNDCVIPPDSHQAQSCELFQAAIDAQDCSGYAQQPCLSALQRCGDDALGAGGVGSDSDEVGLIQDENDDQKSDEIKQAEDDAEVGDGSQQDDEGDTQSASLAQVTSRGCSFRGSPVPRSLGPWSFLLLVGSFVFSLRRRAPAPETR